MRYDIIVVLSLFNLNLVVKWSYNIVNALGRGIYLTVAALIHDKN